MNSTNSALLSHPYDAVLLITSDNYTIQHANENTSKFINIEHEKIIGADFFSCFKKEINNALKNKICKALINENAYQGNNAFHNNIIISPLNNDVFVVRFVYSVESELNKHYHNVFNNFTDAVVISKQGKYVAANKKAEIMFGYTAEEILEFTPEDTVELLSTVEENDVDLLAHKIDKVRHGEDQAMNLIFKRKDDSIFHGRLEMIHNVIGETKFIHSIVKDHTDRVIFEKEIRESEERFRFLSNIVLDSVVFVKEDKIIDCNIQLARLLGYKSKDELIGKKITEYINISDFNRIRTKGTNKTEVRTLTRLKTTLFLEASSSKFDYQGNEAEVFIFYDITSRKKTEQALEQSTERFKNLVENSPNAVFIITDYKIKYTNHTGVSILGMDEEDELWNKNIMDFFPIKLRERISEDLELIREGEEVDYKELEIINYKGNPVEIGLKGTLTVYNNKPSIQLTLNNLTTRKRLVQEQMRVKLVEEINMILKREITEHKVTQQKLKQAQNFTRSIIESSIDMIIAVDKNYIITEFNTAAQKKFGYKSKEIIGQSIKVLYNSEKEFSQVKLSLEKQGTFSSEILNIKNNGEKFLALLSASLIKNPKGEILGSMGVSRDITDIKKAEQELIKSEERYRDIFENTQDFILSVKKEGRFIYTNKAFNESLGYTEQELKDICIYDVINKDCFNKKKSIFSNFISDDLEVVFKSKKGDEIRVKGEFSVRLKDGKKHSIRGIFRDITVAYKKEKEVKEQKAKLESIFNSTENMMMWTMDKKGLVTSHNNNFVSYMKTEHGVDFELGDNYLKVINKHINKNRYQGQLEFYKTAFKGTPEQFELPLLNTDKNPIWLQTFLNPIHIEDTMEEISCLAYDITDRIEISRKIRNSLKEKEVLLQEVHHRVKNNLQVISSILNLQSSFVDDEGTLEILAESQNRIKSMSYIHETLYQTSDFSSIEFTDYINTLVVNLIQTYSVTAGNVRMITDFNEMYLSLDQAIPCGLIMNELVSNALKYAYKDVEDPQLNIRIKKEGKKITLAVQDNGVGLPKDFKYEESDSLGIQLVYILVEQLDGEIKVESKNGTHFLISFDQL